MSAAEELQNAIRLLEQRPCWAVIYGRETWPNLSMHFGEKIPRNRPLPTAVREDVKFFDGEFGLYVECTWRLETETSIIGSSRQPIVEDAPVLDVLGSLENQLVSQVELQMPGMDLTLRFDDGVALRVFCDEIDDSRSNFSFFFPRGSITVGPRSLPRVRRAEFLGG